MDNYVGKMLDNRYEILEVIGVGGMAVVYKTKCHRLNRLVALKILKSEFAKNDDFRKRFHAESQAVAMLSHPNIVAVYDVSRTGETEYIVMELIDGITLKQYMQKKGSLNWRESLHFATQIAKALSHAHGRGIIHRDIKPHNIMILRDGSVKVADFGIARFASKQNTLTQEALGSVHYISPEQARGSHIDARSDIYSVGVVLYEMLTGRLPYEGDSPVSVAIQHINSIPLTPREIDPNIPEALEAITMKAMSPSLGKRYASAEMLLHDLEEFRKNPSISFDYDIDDLTAREEIDEPTKDLATGAVVKAINVKSKRPRELQEDAAYNTRQRNKSLTMMSGILCIVVFITGMLYLAVKLLGTTPSGGDVVSPGSDSVQVPHLLGKHWDMVSTDSAYADLLIRPKNEGKYHDFYEAGVIIEQDPLPNSFIKSGREILVTLSKGKENVSMPDVTNEDYRKSLNTLTDNGFICRDPIYEYSDDIVKDYVIRTDPPAYSTVPSGSTVTVYVSRGPLVEQVTMPSLVDKTREEAERELEKLDLLWMPHTYVESSKPAETVVWQDPPANSKVDVRSEVTLQLSSGPVGGETDDPGETDNPDNPDIPDNPDNPPTTEPSASPSPTPTTPSPQPEKITVPVKLKLPSESGTVKIKIVLNGVIYFNDSVNNSDEWFTFNLTGSPDDSVEIYLNEVFTSVQPLSYFAAP